VNDPKTMTASQQMMRQMLPFVQTALDAIDPEFGEILIRQIFDRVYGREDKLDIKTRELCTVAMLTVLGRLDDLKTHLRVASNLGWTAEEIREMLLICAIPAGWPASFDGLRIFDAFVKESGATITPLRVRPGYHETDWEVRGKENGSRLLGTAAFEKLVSQICPESDDFRGFVVSTVYGKLLTRNVLDERTKFLTLIGAFAALKSADHLGCFIPGALKNGISGTEIKEVLLYCCIYAGQEAMIQALAVYRKCSETT
jgi:4-carboxymuconolactone decarboxylase